MSHKSKYYYIDLIMLSKFGKNDGGRETWAYNFLPKLLESDNISKLNIFGYRLDADEDNSDSLAHLGSTNNKVKSFILVGKKRKYPKFFSMMFGLKKLLKKFDSPKPDYTIAMGIFETILILTNRRFREGITIVWLRSIFLNEKSNRIPKILRKLSQKVEYLLLKKIDILLANGDDIKEYYEEYGLKVKVIKNGVDSEKWDIQPPKLSKSKVIKVAYIGRLSKVKGIESFMNLIHKIKNSSHSKLFEFHIVGDANNYLLEMKKFEDSGWAKYHGCINNDDLPIFLKEIDICVALTFASSSGGGGGTSNALLEQMAASRIIIAWDNVIFRQLLNDTNAYLVKQYSIIDLNDTLLNIYSNQNKAIKKGINAKKTIEPYTITSQIDKFKKLL